MLKKWETNNLEECNLPDEVRIAFISATKNFHGITFKPILYYGKQNFIGVDYAITCSQVTETNPPQESLILMIINSLPNKNIEGKFDYEIKDIKHII
ncbi:hypothetical protein JYG23_01650 [Sedimentibacter sp. zth1]|uniref:hypothetical protein n=1 Tax=Sedimentibacter sp. zth1 TaxID=2816908 RepID=UPI001A92B708|nr:hypothetical protein [Sedimentibacter sp. zth1]QSX06195.1 hypothetical protein JYG23_01650 [Sedimentibacter sp. zth1]